MKEVMHDWKFGGKWETEAGRKDVASILYLCHMYDIYHLKQQIDKFYQIQTSIATITKYIYT